MNIHSRYYLLILLVLFLSSTSHVEAVENKAYLKDGKIVLETVEGVRTIDHSANSGYSQTSLQRWDIKEKVSPVNEALAVYKNRKDPLYNHRINFYSLSGGDVEYFVEYYSGDDRSRYFLPSKGDYVYYLSLNADGENTVYGHHIKENKRFAVSGGNDFQIVTCNENTSFIVVPKGQGDQYDVFDAQGNKISTIAQSGVFEEVQDKIKETICN